MITTNISTFQAIKKPIFFPRFNTTLPEDAVKLAYAASESLDADRNIIIVDRSKSTPENCITSLIDDETFESNTFISLYSSLLITDVFVTGVVSQPDKPLFYIHTLPADVLTNSISVLDQNFNTISTTQYLVDIIYVRDGSGTETAVVDYVALYNDFKNSYDEDTGELIVYYVQYTDSSNVTYTVMINNDPIFHEASFSDIDWTSITLKSWVKAYIREELNQYFTYTLPSNSTYTVRYVDTPNIELLSPLIDDNSMPWFIRVRNGSFITTYNDIRYTYRLPEFNTQAFNPMAPYKQVAEELVQVVSDNLVALPHTPLAVDTWPLDVIIKDKHGRVMYAFTTNTGKHGTDYLVEGTDTGVNWDANKIMSYDSTSGLVQLNVLLKDYYQVYATYYYTEEYYEYQLVNFNPLSNQDVLENFYVFYLVPEASANSNLGVQTVSLHYLRVGQDGLIKACSQDGTNGEPDIKDLLVDLVSYGRPTFGAGTFLTSYSLECSTGADGESRRYLILGEVSVVQQTCIDDLTILDDRQAGGGIKEDQVTAAKIINPEVLWYTDIGMGGGISYPGYATVIVQLPHCLLDTYGGPFSENALQEIVKQHLAFGHYPIIRYYGMIPDLSIDDAIVAEAITITWPSMGNGSEYNVFYSTGSDYTQHNITPISDNPSGNTYTLTSLTAGEVYQIYVQATNNNPCMLPRETGMFGTQFFIGGDNGENWNTHAGPRSKTLTVMVSPFSGSI